MKGKQYHTGPLGTTSCRALWAIVRTFAITLRRSHERFGAEEGHSLNKV